MTDVKSSGPLALHLLRASLRVLGMPGRFRLAILFLPASRQTAQMQAFSARFAHFLVSGRCLAHFFGSKEIIKQPNKEL